MNKNWRKIFKSIALIMTFLMVLTMTACGGQAAEEAAPAEISETFRVAALNGPTGIATVDLADNEMIELSLLQAPDEAVQKLVADEVDIAAIPSNLASVLYNKTDGNVVALTTVASGVLYLLENGDSVKSIEDLSGKTIVGSGKGGTPEYVLTLLLENAGLKVGEDVQIEWLDAHADVAQKMMQNPGTVALLPEPFVSNVTSQNENISIAIDLNEQWNTVYGGSLPMGVIVAKKSLVETRGDDITTFLTLLGESVDDVNTCSDEVAQKIVDAGFLADVDIAKSAIPRCNITCMDPGESRLTLEPFFQSLFEVAPESIGGAMPAEDIYYEG